MNENILEKRMGIAWGAILVLMTMAIVCAVLTIMSKSRLLTKPKYSSIHRQHRQNILAKKTAIASPANIRLRLMGFANAAGTTAPKKE